MAKNDARFEMIHPSYVELMQIINNQVEVGEEPMVNSRYTIVAACAKRARQLIAGASPMIENTEGMKPITIAVHELAQGKLVILNEEEALAARTAAEAAARAEKEKRDALKAQDEAEEDEEESSELTDATGSELEEA
nr:DNA-directed RNA polymerase subunit omega [uncultured Shuttleworthia sp.]